MTVLAKKHKFIGLLYAVVAVMGIVLVCGGFGETETAVVVAGALMSLIAIVIVIKYLKTPSEPIKLNINNELVLPEGTFSFAQITDISYKRASAKGIQYKWGKVIIETTEKKYVYNYISNCEQVAKDITKIKYENQMIA